MKIKGFLVLFGPNFGKWKDAHADVETDHKFLNKFFLLQDDAEASVTISREKSRKHKGMWHDYQIVRIECEGKVL